jgi:HSP20 family protein
MPDEWMPDMDLFVRGGKLVVRADIPGVTREDVEVKIEGQTLVLQGEREEEIKEEDCFQCERPRGGFVRTVDLPSGFDPRAIEAIYKDGVLEVTVPKAALEKRAVKVEIK